MELLLSGRIFSGTEAVEMGLVSAGTRTNSSLACAHHCGKTGDRPSLPRGQVAIHDHRHLARYATARLQRLQSRIDRLDGAVDGLADVRDHKSLRRPPHRQSHPALEKGTRLAVERGGFGEVAQQIDVDP